MGFYRDPSASGGGPSSGQTRQQVLDLIAAAGLLAPATKDVALGTNSKTVAMSNSQVVLSDWEVLALTTDSTTGAGFTVASNEIVFAEAGAVDVRGGLLLQGDGTGGSSRIYPRARARITSSSGTVSRPLAYRDPNYEKSAPDGSLAQGPDEHILGFCWPLVVAAGDKLAIEWKLFAQSNTMVAVVAAQSAIAVRTWR